MIIKCKKCGKEENYLHKGLCGKCYSKKWRKDNPARVKEYAKFRYQRDKEKILIANKKWIKENPEKARRYSKEYSKRYCKTEHVKIVYKKSRIKNKDKMESRVRTNEILRNKDKYKNLCFPKNFFICKECNSKERLQLHHEIYPIKREEVIKAINEGKIYYLCYVHHHIAHGRFKDKIQKTNNHRS